MNLLKSITAGVVAASLGLASTAQAAETRSFGAIPAKTMLKRSVSSNRELVSQQAGGFPFLIVFVVVAAGLGLYFAVHDGGNADTPGS